MTLPVLPQLPRLPIIPQKPTVRDVIDAVLDARARLQEETPHSFIVVDRLYVQLGDLQYHLVGPVAGMDSQHAYNYAEHAIVEGKPRLQYVGDGIESITLTFEFHAELGDPDLEIAALKALASAHQAVPLIWASGEVRGRFVIIQVDETLNKTDALGRRLQASVRVTLKEWVDTIVHETTTAPRRAVTKRTAEKPPAIAPAPTPATITDEQYKAMLEKAKRNNAGVLDDPHEIPRSVITRRP